MSYACFLGTDATDAEVCQLLSYTCKRHCHAQNLLSLHSHNMLEVCRIVEHAWLVCGWSVALKVLLHLHHNSCYRPMQHLSVGKCHRHLEKHLLLWQACHVAVHGHFAGYFTGLIWQPETLPTAIQLYT